MIKVVGLDISQTATGVCDGGQCWTMGQGGAPDDPYDQRGRRMRETAEEITSLVLKLDPAVVGVEKPLLGGREMQYGDWDRAGLWWRIVCRLQQDVPIAYIHLTHRAIYATGNGRAAKKDVYKAARRLWPQVGMTNHNEGDAAVLGAMCAHHFGDPWPTELPDGTLFGMGPERERALTMMDWPVIIT